MIKPRFVFALSFVVTAVCVWQTQVAAGQGTSPGVRCRLEPAPDSTLNATALPSIVIPRLPKAPVIDGVWSAEEWKDAREAEVQEHGVQAANLTATERAAVVELRTALEEVGLSVREALSIAIAQRKREQSCTQPVRKVRKHLPLPRRQGPLGGARLDR